MSTEWQIILSGSGGQGLGMAGQILAEAASFYGGLEVVHNQSYGARARGGFSQSTVIISSHEIIHPFVEHPNLIITLSQEAYDLSYPQLAQDGKLVYDLTMVAPKGDPREKGYPISDRARALQFERYIAMMALGVLVQLTGLLQPQDIEKALQKHFTGRVYEQNRQSFLEGIKLIG
ncbi:MAG: 2-oxoacid:acceptor oxidoreductase family protein [Bacillota bacterium]